MRDLHNNIAVKRGISPKAAGTDNTPWVSEIVDLLGYGSCEFVIAIGANTDTNATFAVLVEESAAANMDPATAVADAHLLGTEAQAGFLADGDDNKVKKIGYVGNKRYVRVTITPSANDSGNIFLAGVWLLGHPQSVPTANPPRDDMTHNAKVYHKQGGDELVVADGGKITVETGGTIESDGDAFVAVEFDTDYFEVVEGEVTLKADIAALLELIADIPTADPEVDWQVWNDSGTLVVSHDNE